MARVTLTFADTDRGFVDFRADFHRYDGEETTATPAQQLARTVIRFLEREAVQKVETPPTLAELTGA